MVVQGLLGLKETKQKLCKMPGQRAKRQKVVLRISKKSFQIPCCSPHCSRGEDGEDTTDQFSIYKALSLPRLLHLKPFFSSSSIYIFFLEIIPDD